MAKVVRVSALIVLILVAVAPGTAAWDSRSGSEVVIGPDEVIADDLYVSAERLVLEGRVKGDLLFVGRTAEIDGTVDGDVLAVGQSVNISGKVGDDARILAQVVAIGAGAQVGDDLVASGYSLEARPQSSVGGGVIWLGYQALLAGDVAQDVKVGAGGLELRGNVGGNVVAEVGEPGAEVPFMMFMPGVPSVPSVPSGLTVHQDARVGGDLKYTCQAEVDVPSGVVAGQVVHNRPVIKVEKQPSFAQRALDWFLKHLRRLLAFVLVGLLMVWAVPSLVGRAAADLRAAFLPSLGWGAVSILAFLLAVLAVVVVTVLLAIILGLITLGDLMGTVITVGLVLIAVLSVSFVVLVTYVSKVIVGLWGGRLLLSRFKPEWSERRVWSLVVGLVILVALTAIPWVGGVIALLAALLGVGSLARVVRAWQRT